MPDTSWHAAVETCYAQTSKHVLDIMVGPHKLLVHLQGMRRYLLLGQGDFVTIFIENIKCVQVLLRFETSSSCE